MSDRSLISSLVLQRIIAVVLLVMWSWSIVSAQPRIAAIRPDAAGPGMNVIVEVLAPAQQMGAFGPDGLMPAGTRFVLENPTDSMRVVIGPVQVSWNGRLVQVPIFVLPQATSGAVPFHLVSNAGSTPRDSFYIQLPQHLGPLTGSVSIGDLSTGILTDGNTLVVDSLTIQGTATISVTSADPTAANPRLQPVTILSKGRVRLLEAEVSVSARGLDGGPGGGGGGHAHSGVGGAGFTGGGNSSALPSTNVGAGSAATDTTGGESLTGVYGGQSEKSDQGGGGGTGNPFGISGRAGVGGDTSKAGGYGGGSGGGELAPQIQAYGGGGGGFATDGQNGAGIGANGGHTVGGRFLIPVAGGSGGGAGNALNEATDGGSGGGGGGAISIVSYDSLTAVSTTFYASGDSGTSGANLTAGGGGGSGGAIYLAAARGALGQNFGVNVDGGGGGKAGTQGGRGGNGGTGRFRIDGAIVSCSQCALPNAVQGPAIFPDTTQHKRDSIQVQGAPSDPQHTSDTMRIFYRTRHTGWLFVDTIRYSTTGPVRWSKWLPAYHDSLLFVAAFSKVISPDKSTYNYEPNWLPSHVGLALIRHKASPFLVVADSQWIGQVKRGRCFDTWLRLENRGEQPLRVDSVVVDGASAVKVLSTLPRTLNAYSSDSVLIHFCPDSAKSYRATLTVFSNDSLREVRLAGLGLQRSDSLILAPKTISLKRIRVGTCDSIDVRAFTNGSDTVYLLSRTFTQGPFTLRVLAADTAIAPGDTAVLRLYYCLPDTGTVQAVMRLAERGDSLTISGFVFERRFALSTNTDSIALCGATELSMTDTLSNLGNDTATVLRLRSTQGAFETAATTPFVLTGSHPVQWTSLSTSAGVTYDTLVYVFADTVLYHPIVLHRTVIDVRSDSVIAFGTRCLSSCDTLWLHIRNNGIDGVEIHVDSAVAPFFETNRDVVVQSALSDSLAIIFCPSEERGYSDTIEIHCVVGDCESRIPIVLTGTGTSKQLSVDTVRFDSVIVGTCATDSVTISNPCGPDVIVSSITLDAPFHVDASELPLTVQSGTTKKVAITFCPDSATASSSDVTLTTTIGDSFTSRVFGTAYDTTSRSTRLAITIESFSVTAGEVHTSRIRLDSSSVTGIHLLTGSIFFDHTLLYPKSVAAPFIGERIAADSLRITGSVDAGVRGGIGSIDWLGLLGPASATSITATWDLDTLPTVAASRAEVTIEDCSGLAGHVSAATIFSISQAYPNPASGSISFLVTSSGDGSLPIYIYDRLGRLEWSENVSLRKGLNNLSLPGADLPPGIHSVVFAASGSYILRAAVLNR